VYKEVETRDHKALGGHKDLRQEHKELKGQRDLQVLKDHKELPDLQVIYLLRDHKDYKVLEMVLKEHKVDRVYKVQLGLKEILVVLDLQIMQLVTRELKVVLALKEVKVILVHKEIKVLEVTKEIKAQLGTQGHKDL
jgi:hypothetical protein